MENGKGQAKYVTDKTVKNDSFFNFFAPPEVPEETEQLLEADFEIGHFFRERLIPKTIKVALFLLKPPVRIL